jgi:hypothetical protein
MNFWIILLGSLSKKSPIGAFSRSGLSIQEHSTVLHLFKSFSIHWLNWCSFLYAVLQFLFYLSDSWGRENWTQGLQYARSLSYTPNPCSVASYKIYREVFCVFSRCLLSQIYFWDGSLSILPRLAWDLWFSCLSLLAGIAGMCCHAQPRFS